MGTICYLSFLYPRKPGFSLDLLHWNLWVMGLGIGPSKFLPFILSRVTITVAMKSISPGRFFVLLFKNHSCDFYKRRLPLALGSHSFSMKHTKQRVFFYPSIQRVKYYLLVNWLVRSITIEMYFVQGSVLTVTGEVKLLHLTSQKDMYIRQIKMTEQVQISQQKQYVRDDGKWVTAGWSQSMRNFWKR